MSLAVWNSHSGPLDVSSNVKLPFWTTRCQYWGSISQSRFVCHVWCSVLKASILDSLGGPSAKVGLSTKFGVAVFKASILDSLGVHLPKYVCLPSFVYWYSRDLFSIHWGVGGALAKVGLSTKFGVVVYKASILGLLGGPLAKAKWCSCTPVLSFIWSSLWRSNTLYIAFT